MLVWQYVICKQMKPSVKFTEQIYDEKHHWPDIPGGKATPADRGTRSRTKAAFLADLTSRDG
uniref:Uncharacterized protein n=1 Tax=Romanomermis culicivorax TaxID=13658 RepID=A0A915HMY7_ROMCU